MKIGFVAFLGTAAVATVANADFIGWTANVRNVSGGYLINVFAVTDNSSDAILNVYGGTPGTPGAGFITTNSAGGFKQGAGAQGVWKPSGNQNWTTLDSFLTVGGSITLNGQAFLGNGSTVGDPPWNVSYTDTDTGEATTANAFDTASNASGFENPYLNSVPATGGFFIAGVSSPARSLALASNRVASSSAAAASASFGMMVAQLYVTDLDLAWKMGATLQRANGSTSQGTFEFTIPVPAPGAIALLGVAGLTAGRRRRA